MKSIDLTNVKEASESVRLQPGGYVCKIVSVRDVPADEKLIVEYDIVEGDFKGYYETLYSKHGFWAGKTTRSYKEKALPFFKAFITAVEQSNRGYRWNSDENNLVGKLVGIIMQNEEYRGNDGEVKSRLNAWGFRDVSKIRSGDFKIPADKKLADADNALYAMPASVGLPQQVEPTSNLNGSLSDFQEVLGASGDLFPFV